MASLRTEIRAYSRFGSAAITTLACLGLAEVKRSISPKAQAQEIFDHYERRWAQALLWLAGAKMQVQYSAARSSPSPAHRRPQLVVANHRSSLDILLLCSLFGGALVSRGDLEHWPVLGLAARRAGTIFVDKERSETKIAAIRSIRKTLASGRNVCIFPEGGTFFGDEVRPFHSGAFAAARGLEVDIIPVAFAYPPGVEYGDTTFGEHAKDIANRRYNSVAIAVGPPSQWNKSATEAALHYQAEVQSLTYVARAQLESKSGLS